MQKTIEYTIFLTKWGYFGLAGTESGLLRTCLPMAEYEKVRRELLKDLEAGQFDKNFFKKVQQQVIAYFEGDCINFEDFPVVMDGLGCFAKSVLAQCRRIKFGQTISYLNLARKIKRADAARAVGGVLARNPLPLIIPCHRVICSSGKIGGFSAAGGRKLKKRLLIHEKH